MNNSSLIKQWFFDEFENILDELTIINEVKKELLDANHEEFEEEIDHQTYDEYVRSVAITCSSKLGLSYEECYDELENNLQELYYAFD